MNARYLTLAQLAKLIGVGFSTVSNWRTRHADFPRAHVGNAGSELFPFNDVSQWLSTRKIPKNVRSSDEPAGTTYAQRLPATKDGNPPPRRPGPAPTTRLWEAMDQLRDTRDTSSAIHGLMELLHLQHTDQHRWRSLVAASTPESAQGVLERTSVDRSLLAAAKILDGINVTGTVESVPVSGYLTDALLERYSLDKGLQGGQFTPASLVRCMLRSLGEELSGALYDPFSGSGEFLAAAAAHKDLRLFGQTTNPRTLRMSRMNIHLHGGQADLRVGGLAPVDDKFVDELFDYVVTNPPYNATGLDLHQHSWPYGPPPASNTNVAWLQHVATKLAPHGRAAVLMPATTVAERGERLVSIRRAMIDADVVECVVALPPRLFQMTSVASTLWLLRGHAHRSDTTGILLIDASARTLDSDDVEEIVGALRAWRSGEHQGTPRFCRAVDIDEISRNDHVLHPPSYLAEPDDREGATDLPAIADDLRRELRGLRSRAEKAPLDPLFSAIPEVNNAEEWPVVELGELCQVLAGPGKLDRDDPGPRQTSLVLPRNIHGGRIDHGQVERVTASVARRYHRYLLVAGDIVCTRAGSLGRYGIVTGDDADRLLGPGCTRLRPTGTVDPGYLTHFLGAPEAFTWVRRQATGTVIQHINTTTLRRLPVRLPPIDVQQRIVAAIDAFNDLIALHEQISASGTRMRDLIIPLTTSVR